MRGKVRLIVLGVVLAAGAGCRNANIASGNVPCAQDGTCASGAVCALRMGEKICAPVGSCPAGQYLEGADCLPTDPCLTSNGGCSANASCAVTGGAVACTCLVGYRGDGKTCTALVDCTTDNGGCSPIATCTPSASGRTCQCPWGFVGPGEQCYPLELVAGNGEPGTTDGFGPQAQLHDVLGVSATSGAVFISDSDNGQVRKLDLATWQTSTAFALAPTPSGQAIGGDFLYVLESTTGTINQTALANPVSGAWFHDTSIGFARGLAIDDAGANLIVGECTNNKVMKVAVATKALTVLAGAGGADDYLEGASAKARFACPAHVAFASGKVYVADFNNHRIRAIDWTTGAVSLLAGKGTDGRDDGEATAATFSTPEGLAVLGGALYVGDGGIRAVDLATGRVSTLTRDIDGASLYAAAPYLYVGGGSANRVWRIKLQ